MEQVLESGLSQAKQANVSYVDLWVVELEEKEVSVVNGVSDLRTAKMAGLCVRVLSQGRWGFASGPLCGSSSVDRITNAALINARFALSSLGPVRLSQSVPILAEWEGSCLKDPFAMPDSQVAELLQAADNSMNIDGITQRLAFMHFRSEHRHYINSEGTRISHRSTLTGGGIRAMATGKGELLQRSWPCPGGSFAGRGYEYIEELDLPGHAADISREAVSLGQAPVCPEEVRDLIIAGPQLAMHIHYSCGRRAQLGIPGCFPPQEIGTHRFGSPRISIIADASVPGGAGSFGYDYEGVKAQSFPIIQEGKFINYLSGREQAASIGRPSSGAMRAAFLDAPIPSMTNLVLQPDSGSLKGLCSGTERGILLTAPRAFTYDSSVQEYVAQAELGWLIEDGEITQMVKNPIYKGNSTAFWSGCDAVAGLEQQEYYGIMDGSLPVGHLVVPVRIRGVKVGAGI